MRSRCTLSLCLLVTVLAAGCSGGGARRASDAPAPESAPVKADRARKVLGDERKIAVTELSEADKAELARAWGQFLDHSPLWRVSLRSMVERGGARPYVLSENLFRHFFTASVHSRQDEIDRVSRSVQVIGEPAVAYFAKPLVEDLVPLDKPVVAEVTDPTNPEAFIKKTFHHFQIDDFTRRDAARVLVAIGPPAVPTLASAKVLRQGRGRRYAAFALGLIGTDEAVAALEHVLDTSTDWQDRAAAVKGLGAALSKNPLARAAIEKAMKDEDAFVRKKADEAMAGRTKLPF